MSSYHLLRPAQDRTVAKTSYHLMVKTDNNDKIICEKYGFMLTLQLYYATLQIVTNTTAAKRQLLDKKGEYCGRFIVE